MHYANCLVNDISVQTRNCGNVFVSTFWSVDVSVRRRFSLSTFRCVGVVLGLLLKYIWHNWIRHLPVLCMFKGWLCVRYASLCWLRENHLRLPFLSLVEQRNLLVYGILCIRQKTFTMALYRTHNKSTSKSVMNTNLMLRNDTKVPWVKWAV